MKPIETLEDLGRMEEIFRLSERRVVSAYIRSLVDKDPVMQPLAEALSLLAENIEQGKHWSASRLATSFLSGSAATVVDKLQRLDDFITKWRARILDKTYHLQDAELFGQLLTLNTIIDFRRDQDTRV